MVGSIHMKWQWIDVRNTLKPLLCGLGNDYFVNKEKMIQNRFQGMPLNKWKNSKYQKIKVDKKKLVVSG